MRCKFCWTPMHPNDEECYGCGHKKTEETPNLSFLCNEEAYQRGLSEGRKEAMGELKGTFVFGGGVTQAEASSAFLTDLWNKAVAEGRKAGLMEAVEIVRKFGRGWVYIEAIEAAAKEDGK